MPLRHTLILLVLLLAVPPARGAEAFARFLFTGTVTEPGGRPVRGARVALEGVAAATAVTDAAGGYALTHVLAAVTPSPARLVLRASHRGWRLGLPSGETSLALELRRVAAGDSVWLEVRANDAEVVKAVARALAAGAGATVALEARFTRLVGPEDRAAPVLEALEVVPLEAPAAAAAVPVPAVTPPAGEGTRERPASLRLFPGAPDRAADTPVTAPVVTPAAIPAPDTAAAPATAPVVTPDVARAPVAAPDTAAAPVAVGTPIAPPPMPALPDTATRPGIRVSVRADSAASVSGGQAPAPAASPLRVALGRAVPAAPASGAGDCRCRVSGTVEVRSERPVRGRPRVVLSLAGRPAPRDTVAIFMGPPRPFDLGRVPCGRQELEVRVLGSRLRRVAPDSLGFACVADGARQFRVVLEPR